jgi:hypothetical protein
MTRVGGNGEWAILCLFALGVSPAAAQPPAGPSRAVAHYTQIYSDNIETMAPSLGPAFILDMAGSLTSSATEVISGQESIKGAYFGAGSYTPYLQTNPSVLPLSPNHPYQVTFQYKILTVPSVGFEVLLYSPTGGAAGNFLPSVVVTGPAGSTGTATLTNTLGPYTDYQARWDVIGTGAISIDNIQISDVTTGQVIATENAEGTAPGVGPGLQLQNGALVTTDPALVLAGNASLRLTNYGTVATNPSVWQLSGNTTYLVQFQYRILNPGSGGQVLNMWFQPAGSAWSLQSSVYTAAPLMNAPSTGTFSAGALTGAAGSWTLYVSATSDSDVVVDSIAILRQDAGSSAAVPSAWSKLGRLPYPRLGKYMLGTTFSQAQSGGLAEGPPYRISVNQVESALAFSDVMVGIEADSQTEYPDSIYRLRQLNPNAAILPYRIAEEQSVNISAPTTADTDLDYLFLEGVADAWYLRASTGNYVSDPDYPSIRKMNISPYCPPANGQTYFGYLLNWLNGAVFPSGVWDGVFFDNLFARVNPHIPNYDNPALIDTDYNLNGIRDETPAWDNDMTRTAAIGMLQQLGSATGNMQLVVGNAGPMPELNLAPYVNGYVFECMNTNWNASNSPNWSPAAWRTGLEAYLAMQANTQSPHIDVLEACGPYTVTPGSGYTVPTASDLQNHRLTMGTALLSDGFYDFALHGSLSAPLWMDEFSVDSSGTAVEDTTKKGYLGLALTAATELTGPGTVVLQEGFENGVIPSSFVANPPGAVSITQTPGQVIDGNASLVLSNPVYTQTGYVAVTTNSSAIPLAAGNTYLMAFDWRILETLDNVAMADIFGNGQTLDYAIVPGVVTGDSGTMWFPVTIPSAGDWVFRISILNGGGMVAIDNVRIYQGGVGLWRRDFEKGFVLVNPFNQPHTFSASDLAGSLNRTGIHAISGTQAPTVNTGQSVTGSLTLGAFDAIVLLADTISLYTCDINGDGVVNVVDVQRIINEALGVSTPVHDLNNDGVVNVVDVQIVINAALGLGCTAA